MTLRLIKEIDLGRSRLLALTLLSLKRFAVLLCGLPALAGCASKYDAYMSDQEAGAYCRKQADLVKTNLEICSRMLTQPRLYVKPCLDSGEIPGSPRFAECALRKIRVDQSRSEARKESEKESRIKALEDEVERMSQENELGRLQQKRN
jgi:TolA-binding protein